MFIDLLLKQFIEYSCKPHLHATFSSRVHDPLIAHFQSLLMRVGIPRAFMHSIGTEIEYTYKETKLLLDCDCGRIPQSLV